MSGALYLVGLGPGARQHLTLRAADVLGSCDAVVGYDAYVDQVEEWLPSEQRRAVRLPLGQERERAVQALDLARSGLRVALVSSGDPAVYGMGGPLFDLLSSQPAGDVPVEVVPGVTAALAASALVGAAVADDLALISLSDLLTPWPLVLRRVEMAAQGGFVLALYNPASERRQEQIVQVQQLLLDVRGPQTPVAVVRSALTLTSAVRFSTLAHFLDDSLPDMHSIVLIGNDSTVRVGPWLVSGQSTRRVHAHG